MLRIGALRGRLLSASALASVLSVATVAASAGALPGSGHYVAGKGEIGKAGQSLTVKQSSTTGIIDWNSFSIGSKNSVSFNNGSGATLNCVTGGDLSKIAGSLHATGSLYLMNAQGVIVSGTGRVVTGGSFVASSSNSDSLQSDRLKLTRGKVINRGTIVAGDGVTLAGRDVSDSGSISAASANLQAANRLRIDGAITARNADGSGGMIVATARHIDVGATANLSASGTHGGTVLIGGDIHGGAIASDNFIKQTVGDAQTTEVAKGAQISADASKGAGGNIVIWSDGHTSFAGQISAKGQTAGGFSEVSSHDLLGFTGRVDLTSMHGTTGTLLLDPENVTIEDADSVTESCTATTCTPTADNSILNVADLEAALATASVKVTTGSSGAQTGDITVLDPVTWSSDHTLTLDAYHSVIIDAPVTILGAGGLTLKTDDGGTGGVRSIGDGAFVDYGPTNNGGKLTINGTSYKLLYTMAQVQAINASSAKLSGHYALATPLDASSTNDWKPLGTNGTGTVENSGNGFSGTFEGLGNIISGLTINIGTKNYAGLFGWSSGVIRDVGMVGGSVKAGSYAGGLLGYNNGGAVTNAFATGAVSDSMSLTGGLVGYSTGSITDSFATGAVSSKSVTAGGLVGYSTGSLTNDHATGSVSAASYAGGLAGYSSDAISNSYATGAVNASTDYAGGLVGQNEGSIDESYSSGAATGPSNAGGIVGTNGGIIGGTTEVFYNSDKNAVGLGSESGTAPSYAGLTTANMMTASEFAGWAFGTTPGAAGFVIVDLDGTLNNNTGSATGATTPMLLSEYSTNIINTHQLQLMELDLSANYTLANSFSASATNGKDIWGAAGFAPIGGNNAGAGFSGTFEGNGHTISGLTIDNTPVGYAGLFGYIDSGTVENLKLTGAAISSNVGNSDVGILAGENDGTVTDVSTSGTVTTSGYAGGLAGNNGGSIDASSSSADVSNMTTGGYLGGLVGYSSGTIDSSSASGKVSGSGTPYAGGLVGENYYATIVNSYASGKVDVTAGVDAYAGGLIGYDYEGQVVSDHATGAVSADDSYNGGLIGVTYYDNVVNSYATGAVSGRDGVAGGLEGYNEYGGISGSHATGKVAVTYGTGTANYAGGLVGYDYEYTYNTITNSYATGAVSAHGPGAAAGGLVGYAYYYTDIGSSHASGAVSVNGEGSNAYAGGLVGETYYIVNIDNSYATGKVTGDDDSYAGGLVGYLYYYNTVSDSYATGAVKGYVAGGLIGYSYEDNFITGSHASGDVTGLLNGSYSYVGGLIGLSESDLSLVSNYATGNVNGGSTTADETFVGGLIGESGNTYPLVSSYATGSVKGGYYIGGLVGYSEMPILDSYATGAVTVASGGDGGGLVGYNEDTISKSYATGSVTGILGTDSYAGGLVGSNNAAIDHSFATGDVTVAGTEARAGGLIGSNDDPLSYVYATGSVTGDGTGTSDAYFGGLVGYNEANITQAYAVGDVSGTGAGLVGGLVGDDNGYTITAGYWDTQTTGQSKSAGGTGRTTAQLQAGLPAGFSSSDWKIIAGKSFPYLKWQVPSGTPEVISGTISGETSDAGLGVHVRVNGNAVTALVGTSSGANGYYYELLAPGTIASSGSDVLAYVTSSSGRANAVYQNAKGSLSSFNLVADTLRVDGSAASETSLLAAMEKALGTNTSYALYTSTGAFTSGTDLDLDLSAASFSINHAINLGSGALKFAAAGTISQSSADAITAARLTGHSAGAAALTSASNKITDLGSFSSGSTFRLTDDHTLTIDGTVNAGSHNIDLTTTGSGHDIAIDAKLEGKTINLVSAAKDTESSAGAIDAHLLNVTAKTGITLTSTHNHIATLGTDHTTSGPNHVTL